MANRIEVDPSKIPVPDFLGDRYASNRSSLIRDPNNPDITNEEQAAAFLLRQHVEENTYWCNQYQAQLRADEAAAAARRQEEEEQQQRREVEQQQRDLEAAQEREKKRAPLYNFVDGESIRSLPNLLHPYAQKRISQRNFVELWYFTPEAYEEASEHRKKPETNTYSLAAHDDDNKSSDAATFTLLGSHSNRPSSNAKPDSELTWEQIIRAKTTFLNALPNGGYPTRFVDMFAQFYVNLELHPELQIPGGDRLLILYHAEMRRAWYLANEHGRPFDLSPISESVMSHCREKIRDQKSARHDRAARGMWLDLSQRNND